jgi:cytochrome P450
VVSSSRLCTRDVEIGGVQMKKGDRVLFSYAMAGLDPDDFPDPFEIRLDRSPNRHMAFAFGPHRCIGSHLARREFKIAFDELFERLPPFRVKAGTTPAVHGGSVFGVDTLELEWD